MLFCVKGFVYIFDCIMVFEKEELFIVIDFVKVVFEKWIKELSMLFFGYGSIVEGFVCIE